MIWSSELTAAAIPVMADVAQAALGHLWVMLTRKTVSLMISARTSTTQVAVRGRTWLLPPFGTTAADLTSDPNCGAAYNAAVDDTALGIANGCGRTNPSNSVSKPSGQPVCR